MPNPATLLLQSTLEVIPVTADGFSALVYVSYYLPTLANTKTPPAIARLPPAVYSPRQTRITRVTSAANSRVGTITHPGWTGICQRVITHGTAKHLAMITAQPISNISLVRRDTPSGMVTDVCTAPP